MRLKFAPVFAPSFALALLLSACVLPAPPARVNAPQQVRAPQTQQTIENTPAIPLYKNLGNHTRKITTNLPEAQQYFDQGLTLTYAFNHEEALKMFKEAARLDPGCAMCYWGIAYVLGPNYNAPMDDKVVPDAYAAIQKAEALSHEPKASESVNAVEHELIHALLTRYAAQPVADRTPLNKAYADAMRILAKKYPEDADIQTLFAESLMDLMPWNLWTKDGKPTDNTEEIVATLEAALRLDPSHPGANHYYIHATEASNTPDRAVSAAERLETLVPEAGHLVHMPAHTYWRVGRYHDAARINEHAVHTDEGHNFTLDYQPSSFYAYAYYPHNITFLIAAASMEGNSAQSIAAARNLVAKYTQDKFKSFPFYQDFPTTALLQLVRFGKWDEVLQEPQPPADLKYAVGIWHYARGLAFLRQGNLDEAKKALDVLKASSEDEEMSKLYVGGATAQHALKTALNILEGEIASTTGDHEHAIKHLEEAVRLDDEIPYQEPPVWYFPVRQALGAVLLTAGKPIEAEAVYREDLRLYPKNGWSLFGLAQSLKTQGKTKDMEEVQKQFEEAWKDADVLLTASRF